MMAFLANLLERWRLVLAAAKGFLARVLKPQTKAPRSRQQVVKSRPLSLMERYRILEEQELGDAAFELLKERLFTAVQARKGETIFREAGRLAPGRPYFFIKPQSRAGWLFERSGAGWVVTPAEKIVARELFLRENEPLDLATLYLARDGHRTLPRVKSPGTGGDLLAFAVYEQRLLHHLGLG